MRIIVDTIPDEGLQVHVDLHAAWAREAVVEALEGQPEALDLDVTVMKLGDHVRVAGEARAAVVKPCDRCGEPVRLRVGGPVDLYYRPDADAYDGHMELADEDMDIGWFDGEALELDAVLIEQLALWAPPRTRCDDPGIEQVEGRHPCVLPAVATAEVDLRPPSPFAVLRRPE